MKFFKTFFILISLAVLNAVLCFNYTLCSDLMQKAENGLMSSKNKIESFKNAEKLTKNYLETSYLETSLKRYAVYQYKKDKILCEPYRVAKNDWLYKIFRKKGEISEKDFPLFINIFKTVNPKINDIDAILPGQIILIPLKRIHDDDFKETSPGVVDVPMIEFASIPEVLRPFIKSHRISKGETISQLLDPLFLNKDGTINAKGMRALKLSNPDLKDVNLIYAGSIVNIPSASLTKNDPDPKTKKIIKQKKAIAKSNQDDQGKIKYSLSKVLKNYASVVGGNLIRTGIFYFPRKNKPDIELDLRSHPLIELANGGKILVLPDHRDSDSLSRAIGKFWKNFTVITLAQAVDSLGINEPEININQLEINKNYSEKNFNKNKKTNRKKSAKDMVTGKIIHPNKKIAVLPSGHEPALKKILSFTNFQYIPDSQISLSFNSMTLNFTLGRISLKDRPDILVDFGTVYGYALEIIRKKGLHIISFPPKEMFRKSLSKLFTDLGMSVTMNPVFVSMETNREITINGLYLTGNMKKLYVNGMLITDHQLDKETLSFLNQKNIKILFYAEDKIK